ncbi:MAG: ISL3 family transposase [Salibacteraceae bacterium]
MTLHLKVPKYHCPDCGRYFRHEFTGIRPRYRSSEAFQLEVFEAHHEGVTQRKLSRSHGISSATVERWYQEKIQQKYTEKDRRSCPQILGIDEHFFTRRQGYATTFVDLKNHKVFDVQLGRSESSLHHYLKRLEGREQARLIVMDLSETYRRIAKQCFPNATIVADRFHVVRLINHHFLKAWKIQDEEGRKNRGLLSLMRRHQWHLRDEQHENLMSYLENFPVLKQLYEVKQTLNQFILRKSVNESYMSQLLPDFLELLKQMSVSPLKGLAKTLTSWIQPILAMWRYERSNGMTEGFHNKMEMLSRRAYGFRNFENYRLRVMTHCGWDGIINRVR